MTRLLTLLLAAAALQIASPALAKNAKHCPPGLAKKSPACVPPGLAKKGVTSEDWKDTGEHNDRPDVAILEDGDVVSIDGDEYVVIDTKYGPILRRGDELYRLPRHDGSDYVRIGDALVRVDRETKAVLDWIKLTHLILS